MTLSAGVSAINWKSLGRTWPIAFTPSGGGANRSVVSFTDCWMTSPIRRRLFPEDWRRTGKDKSRMIRLRRFGWGITATGDILKFAGTGLCLISSQRTIRVNLAATWYSTSSCTSAMASGGHAVGWGPRSTAMSMASWVHGVPQATGTPRSQSRRWLEKGCSIESRNIGFNRLRHLAPVFDFRFSGGLPWTSWFGVFGLCNISARVEFRPETYCFWTD
jgi:hypothetical protein